MCINRFDEDTKLSFKDLYTKIDADIPEALERTVLKELGKIPF